MTCKCFCDLEFAVSSKVCVQIDATALSGSTDLRAAAESSPEVACGGKTVGRSIAFSHASFAVGTVSVSLRTSSGELALLFKSTFSKIWSSQRFRLYASEREGVYD